MSVANARVNRNHSKVSGVRRIDAGLHDGGTKCRSSQYGAEGGPIKLFAGGGDLVSDGFGFAA